jgi:histidine triad (HIT) family protein
MIPAGPDAPSPSDARAADPAARTHAPPGYDCPFCRFARGVESPSNALADIVYDDGEVFAFVSPLTWPANAGNALVVPRAHFEHLYALPDDLAARVAVVAKRIAVAMLPAYGCEGTSTRQHNEPAGGQDVFHYHLHVLPRWQGDRLYVRHAEARFVPAEKRRGYTARLRSVIAGLNSAADGAAPPEEGQA